jgi:hypothetical protein
MILHVRMPPFLCRASEAWPWLLRANPGLANAHVSRITATTEYLGRYSRVHCIVETPGIPPTRLRVSQSVTIGHPSRLTAVLPATVQACLGRKKSRADMQSIAGARR